ncbi:MAG: hypothetical protein A2V81_04900 [Candidatus Abawacabacteria bacterium RBG_16_42_10]|uniref:DUF3352 domain-containing protein n=1 Tax=Candidatus Abawacabacteria bacterium RBG_16_42_10 TaxID=1817814 RepID=A0A1F4XIS4_9BACT|nr:MAG: hypothetical protein A2V81_04900 [Candidatus Abawacabacteria bacterium RBG_16_42_10]
MKRIQLLAISVLVVLGLGTGTYAYVAYDRGLWPFEVVQVPTVALAGSFADMLSDQTAMYMLLDLANADVNKVITSNPKLKTNIDLLKQGWNRLTTEMQNDLNTKNPDAAMFVNNVLTHKVHFAFAANPSIAKDLKQAELSDTIDVSVFGDIVIGVEVNSKDEANSMISKTKELIQKSAALDSTTKIEITEIMFKNHPVTKISNVSTDPASPKIDFALTNIGDRIAIATNNLTVLEGMIDRNQNKSLPSLTNKTSFNTLMSKITEPSWAVMYSDSEKQLQMQTTLNPLSDLPQDASNNAMLEIQSTLLNNPYLKSQSVAAINLSNQGIHFISYFKPTTPGAVSGFRNANQTLANTVPEGALLFVENNDIVSQLSPILEMMAYSVNSYVNMAMGQNSDIFKEWEKETGLSIKDDIAPLFSGDTAFAMYPLNSPLFPVSVTFLSSLNDSTKAKNSMEKITQVIMKQITETAFADLPPPELQEEDVGGVTIHSYGALLPMEAMYNYAFMNSDKLLAISSSTSALKSIISVFGLSSPSLAKSARYPELLKKQSSFSNISFIDVKGIMGMIIPFISELLPEEQKIAFDKDVKPYLSLVNNVSGYSTVISDMIKSEGVIQIVE